MPYRNHNLQQQTTAMSNLVSFHWNPQYSLAEHKDSLRHIYDRPNISTRQLESIIRQDIPGFTLSMAADQSSRARQERRELAQQMREYVLDRHFDFAQYSYSKTTDNPLPGATMNRPYCSFLQMGMDEESVAFNQRLVDVLKTGTPREKADFLFSEIEKARQEAGFNSPEDVYALTKCSDRELVERYPQIRRFLTYMTDTESLLKKEELDFTPEQRRQLNRFLHPGMDMDLCIQQRLQLVISPMYEDLGSQFWLNNDLMCLQNNADVRLEEMDPSGNLANVGRHFGFAFMHNQLLAKGAMSRFITEDPSLADASLGTPKNASDPTQSFTNMTCVVARTQNQETKVLLSGYPEQILTETAYMDKLAKEASAADKWLLTGSKEFSQMQKALKELNTYTKANPGASDQELQTRTEALREAAESYLRHKGIQEPFSIMETNLQGKNDREQQRLNVARSVLEFAQAQGAALTQSLYRSGEKELDLETMNVMMDDAPVPPDWSAANISRHHKLMRSEEQPVQQRQAVPVDPLEERFKMAEQRLQSYISGEITLSSRPMPNSQERYQSHVLEDVTTLAFREALKQEPEETGAYRTLMEQKGYDAAFSIFMKVALKSHAYAEVGLHDISVKAVSNCLNSGVNRLANAVLKTDSTVVQEVVEGEAIKELGKENKEEQPDKHNEQEKQGVNILG